MALHGIAILVAGSILAILLIVYGIMIYNGLVRLDRNVNQAWSNIDVLRKQRADELDKLIDAVAEYMGYEEDVLQEVTEAREQAQAAQGPDEASNADARLEGALANLFARAEDYPELRAADSFQQLQTRISSLEEQIADRREFYNASVNAYNIRINQVPYNVVANMMDYKDRDLFEADEEVLRDVDISDRFSSLRGSHG